MTSSRRAATAAFVALGALAVAVPAASAQRRTPRYGVAAEPQPATPAVPYSAYPGSSVTIDPRGGPPAQWGGRRGGPGRHVAGPQVVYVPVPVDAYGYPVQQGAVYYPPAGYGVGSVVDVNGRPLSAGFEPTAATPPSGAAYTPDLSGAPYVVVQDGVMIVALPSGERSIPACANRKAFDPNGRPRTVFYTPSEYALVLKEGQSGRVQAPAQPAATACYGLDAYGRVAIR